MFIRKQSHGGYRGNNQVSGKGDYLALFSWNGYKAHEEITAKCIECKCARTAYLFNIKVRSNQDNYEWKRAWNAYQTCEEHRKTYSVPEPKYPNGKGMLWAIVRKSSLMQCGHWMMGTIRIGNKSITVSGPIGSDGLPLDYQDVPEAYRHLLIPVPEDIATEYWADNGHNDIGKALMAVLEYGQRLLRQVATDSD